MPYKTIAVLQIANLFSLYAALVGAATVTCDVRLRYNANDLHISSPLTHDSSLSKERIGIIVNTEEGFSLAVYPNLPGFFPQDHLWLCQREAGQSITETATCLNISRQTVSKLWKQFQNDGTVVRRPGQGWKRMTTASEERYLALTARRNRKATARQLSSELAAATGAVASRQTIYRRLSEKAFMPESQGSAYGRDFLFMDDNARPHRANLVDEFLESEDIKRIPWPANSPDLNPIENLWDYLGRAIARRHPPPRDVNGLKTALLEEWSLIPQTVINNVISSLKTRCDMCVRVRGDHIPY
ncbi:transposable element Tcb2 transposase [Trichonephila clavipes]|nr:transposable element Tcb2 transposase [Trichonephila clavipes]